MKSKTKLQEKNYRHTRNGSKQGLSENRVQEKRERLTHSHTPLHLHAQKKSELTVSPRSAQLKIRRKQIDE